MFNPAAGSGTASNGQFSIFGVSSKGTLLLIDGQRMASEFTKNYDAQRLFASMIERIEIIKGPMGALYGSDALGGVMNIITKKPTQAVESQVSVIHGANENGNAQRSLLEADMRGQSGKTGYSL